MVGVCVYTTVEPQWNFLIFLPWLFAIRLLKIGLHLAHALLYVYNSERPSFCVHEMHGQMHPSATVLLAHDHHFSISNTCINYQMVTYSILSLQSIQHKMKSTSLVVITSHIKMTMLCPTGGP